jgi:hypothetical protein
VFSAAEYSRNRDQLSQDVLALDTSRNQVHATAEAELLDWSFGFLTAVDTVSHHQAK